jgi:hypothetical protein
MQSARGSAQRRDGAILLTRAGQGEAQAGRPRFAPGAAQMRDLFTGITKSIVVQDQYHRALWTVAYVFLRKNKKLNKNFF